MTNENSFSKLPINTFVKFSYKSLCQIFFKRGKDPDVILKFASLFKSTHHLQLMCVSILPNSILCENFCLLSKVT